MLKPQLISMLKEIKNDNRNEDSIEGIEEELNKVNTTNQLVNHQQNNLQI